MKKRRIADIEKELIAMPDLTDSQIERCKKAAKKILYKEQDEIKFYYTTHYAGHYMYFCTKCQRWHCTTERFSKLHKHKCECGASLVVTGPVQNQYKTMECDLVMFDKLNGELIARMVRVERTIDKRCNYIEQFEIYEISRVNIDEDIAVKRYSLKTMGSWGDIWHSRYYERGQKWSSDRRTRYYMEYRWNNVIGPIKTAIRGTKFKYCAVDQLIKRIKHVDVRRYLEAYKMMPDLEKFVRAGSLKAVTEAMKSIVYAAEVFRRCVSGKRIGCAVKNDMSVSEMEQLAKVPEDNRNPDVSLIIKMAAINYEGTYQDASHGDKRAIAYVHKQNTRRVTRWHDYNDYIDMIDALGEEKSKKNLYPFNFWDAHDEKSRIIAAEASKKTSQKINRGIRENFMDHAKMSFADREEGLLIRPAVSREELIKESAMMHHCVRMYADKVAKKETEIFFIRKINDRDKPLATLELKENKIIQCRAKYNAVPDKSVRQFVDAWAEKNGFYKIMKW